MNTTRNHIDDATIKHFMEQGRLERARAFRAPFQAAGVWIRKIATGRTVRSGVDHRCTA